MSIKSLLLSGAFLMGALSTAVPASAGSEEYLGEIILVGFNFCPRGTTEADGQLLSIAKYSALFALYGTMYGGDGRSTFAMPDLRGRTALGDGQGPGLTPRRVGQKGGTEITMGSLAKISNGEGGMAERHKPTGADNMPPYQVMKYCIVTNGVFPSRE